MRKSSWQSRREESTFEGSVLMEVWSTECALFEGEFSTAKLKHGTSWHWGKAAWHSPWHPFIPSPWELPGILVDVVKEERQSRRHVWRSPGQPFFWKSYSFERLWKETFFLKIWWVWMLCLCVCLWTMYLVPVKVRKGHLILQMAVSLHVSATTPLLSSPLSCWVISPALFELLLKYKSDLWKCTKITSGYCCLPTTSIISYSSEFTIVRKFRMYCDKHPRPT